VAHRVLLADDDQGTLETVGLILRLAGFETCAALTGHGAIANATTFVPDVALIDLNLPDISGVEVVRALRAQTLPPECLILTGFGTVCSAVEAMRLGAFDYLEKPLFEDEILDAVRQATTLRARLAGGQPGDVEPHALTRWAEVIVRFVSSQEDAATIHGFGRSIGVSAGAFRNWCRTARLSPRRSLLFARALRAVMHGETAGAAREPALCITDPRTRSKFFLASGGTPQQLPPTVQAFFDRQRLIICKAAVEAIKAALRRGRMNLHVEPDFL
jgi:ActR/RegA family two-component response regulator